MEATALGVKAVPQSACGFYCPEPFVGWQRVKQGVTRVCVLSLIMLLSFYLSLLV